MRKQRRGRFQEVQRRFGNVVAELFGVIAVVSTDSHNFTGVYGNSARPGRERGSGTMSWVGALAMRHCCNGGHEGSIVCTWSCCAQAERAAFRLYFRGNSLIPNAVFGLCPTSSPSRDLFCT